MHVSFLRRFLTIIEYISGKIQIITPHQRKFWFTNFFQNKSIHTHVLKIRTNDDRYTVL